MHVRIASLTTPEVSAQFVKELSARKYLVEGKLRKGYAQAHIAELHTYDIRIKREAAPQMLTDIRAFDLGDDVHLGKNKMLGDVPNNVSHHINPFVRFFVSLGTKIVRKVTGHHSTAFNTPELLAKQIVTPAKGWNYVFYIGSYKDPEKVEGNEEL